MSRCRFSRMNSRTDFAWAVPRRPLSGARHAWPVELKPREFDRRCQAQCFAVSGIDRIGIDQQPLKLAQRGSERRIIEIQHRPLDTGDPRIQFLRQNCRIVVDGGEQIPPGAQLGPAGNAAPAGDERHQMAQVGLGGFWQIPQSDLSVGQLDVVEGQIMGSARPPVVKLPGSLNRDGFGRKTPPRHSPVPIRWRFDTVTELQRDLVLERFRIQLLAGSHLISEGGNCLTQSTIR